MLTARAQQDILDGNLATAWAKRRPDRAWAQWAKGRQDRFNKLVIGTRDS